MKNIIVIIAVLLFLFAGVLIFLNQSNTLSRQNQSSTPSTTNSPTTTYTFLNPKKSAHYESNTPSHGSVLAGVPVNIVIDFNFDLAKPSKIEILNGNSEYGTGQTVIDTNKLAMRRNMKIDSPDGLYTVKYNACWPDGSCHDGSFQFAIDRSQSEQFSNQTGKKEVIISLLNTKFVPETIKVSKGTKVTWVNNDSVDHYVNTDSHPAHTYYPNQNSKVLKKGESFSLTFTQPGIYPYHCSAHSSNMRGSLLVE